MARPETQSREQLIEALEEVFLRDGYEGASMARLAEAAGLAKAALYHRFPEGKAEMAEAVLLAGRRHLLDGVVAPLLAPGDPRARLEAMCATLDLAYRGGTKSCVADIFSIKGTPPALRAGLKVGMRAWIEAVARVLVDAGLPEPIADSRALEAVTRIEGALVVSRALEDTSPFKTLLAVLPDRLLAAP